MIEDFYPFSFALWLLKKAGFKPKKNIANEGKKGIKKEQLKAISQIKLDNKLIKTSAYDAIARTRASKNDLDVNAAAARAVHGAVQYSIMDYVDEIGDQIIIEWLPSSAKNPSVEHGRHYRKKMTLKQAVLLGLGVRHGCECGFRVLAGQEVFSNHISKLNNGEGLHEYRSITDNR